MNKIKGDAKYTSKFPKTLLKQKYRKCKPKHHVGLGSWLKELLEPLEKKVEKAKILAEATKTKASSGGSVNKALSKAEEKSIVDPDIVSPKELMKVQNGGGPSSGSPAAAALATKLKTDPAVQNVVARPPTPVSPTGACGTYTFGQSCITKENLAKCQQLIADGCLLNNVVAMESCPLQFSCAGDAGGTAASSVSAAASHSVHRGHFMTYLWFGIGIAVVGTVFVFYRKKQSGGRRRRSSNEKISREVGDEFL